MADPRAFISFDFDHNITDKNLFAGQSKNSRTPFNIQDWSSKEELPDYIWQEKIKEKINKCNLMVVLVGKFMRTATGVVKEIKLAKECDVPFFGVYVSGADSSSNLPEGLYSYRTITWEWDKIADWINKCMKEGKNK